MNFGHHGGQSWGAIGEDFQSLDRRLGVNNADVLDAWFAPCPTVLETLTKDMAWIANTSPPTHSEGLVTVLSETYDLSPDAVLTGPGSSALMYAAWPTLVHAGSRVLLLEPMYGEYSHLARELSGAQTDWFQLDPDDGFRVDTKRYLDRLWQGHYDLAVLVNPINPTGSCIDVATVLREGPADTIYWIDEAYIDYTTMASVQSLAASSRNVIVLKSLSKVFALSGLRAAYLVAHPERIASIRKHTPPWWVSLPAQIAAIKALGAKDYYLARYAETNELRTKFLASVRDLSLCCRAETANWVLLELPPGLSAQATCDRLAHQGIFVRNAGLTAPSLRDQYLRIAIKALEDQGRIVDGLRQVLGR